MITVGKVFDMHRESVVQDARQHPEDPLVPRYLEFLEEAKLFDFSALRQDLPEIKVLDFEDSGDFVSLAIPTSSFSLCLPFVSNFILVLDSKNYYQSVLLEEWEPLKIGGCVYIKDIMVSFTIFLEDSPVLSANPQHIICFNIPSKSVFRRNADMQEFTTKLVQEIVFCFSVFEKLADYYYTRVEEGQSKPFYIKMPSDLKARKISSKPIIIFLSQRKAKTQKEMDELQRKYPKYKIMHSFPVRGHWRRLKSPDKVGKDRRGNYNQFGFTWVKECIKGSGVLVKRPYVVLPGGSSNE